MLNQRLRLLRIFYVAFLFAMLMQAAVLFMVVKPTEHEINAGILYAFGGMAIAGLLSAQFYLRYRLRLAAEAVAVNENDPKPYNKWQAYFIFALAANEAAFLWGWMLCFMGASVKMAGTIMLLSFLSQLSFFPQRP